MEEKKHSINRTDDMTRQPDTSGGSANTSANTNDQNEGNEDVGVTPTQLNNIQRSPSERGLGSGARTKPFITGTDSDGQL